MKRGLFPLLNATFLGVEGCKQCPDLDTLLARTLNTTLKETIMSNIYKVNSLGDYKKQREKKEGLKNLFLERIDPKKSREEIVQQLISALKKNCWKFTDKKGR